MKSFLEKIKYSLANFMRGRNGADQLCLGLLIAGLVLSLLASITGIGLLSLLGLACYILSLFRMFSRNTTKRSAENVKFLNLTADTRKKLNAFLKRQKNRKEYKYFKCPKCHVLIRLRRGTGEVDVVCPRCGEKFHQKA